MRENTFPGVMLRERRQAMGFSIEGARARTYVPAQFLQAFESGKFDDMPEQAYAVGFLRSYCRFLDMDPEPFVDHYLICTQPKQVPATPAFNFVKREEPRNDTVVRPLPLWVNDLITWGAVCAVILLGWLTYSMLIRPFVENVKDRVEAGAVEVEAPIHFEEEF